jgi:HTH-type transcriptional regulator/antitoxin HipB
VSRVATLQELAALVRSRRDAHGWSQAALAERAGVSRKWVGDLEAANPTVELAKVLAVLDALSLELAVEARASGRDDSAVDLDALLTRFDGPSG